jgi:hypothetical protein
MARLEFIFRSQRKSDPRTLNRKLVRARADLREGTVAVEAGRGVMILFGALQFPKLTVCSCWRQLHYERAEFFWRARGGGRFSGGGRNLFYSSGAACLPCCRGWAGIYIPPRAVPASRCGHIPCPISKPDPGRVSCVARMAKSVSPDFASKETALIGRLLFLFLGGRLFWRGFLRFGFCHNFIFAAVDLPAV